MSIFELSSFMKGMNYAGFQTNVFKSAESDQAIDHLAQTGVNWVAINVFWYQEDGRATLISPHESKTASDSSLYHLIRKLRNAGQKILLKPMVDALDHTWRGQFEPSNWEDWFESYRIMMFHYARIAEEMALDLFCIGCEFPMKNKHQHFWLELIREVRDIYSGPLTYAANHNKKSGFKRVAFWDQLDYIGIDAYFSVAGRRKNTNKRMMRGWNHCIRKIDRWYQKSVQKIPVIFTELGVTSVKGGTYKPWEYKHQKEPDWEEQAKYYESFFRSFEACDWLAGAFWWWWDNPSTGDFMYFNNSSYQTSYTPKGKDAEAVIKSFWAGIV